MLSREEITKRAKEIFQSFADIDVNGQRNITRIERHFANDLKYRLPFFPEEISFSDRQSFMTMLAATNGLFSSSDYTLSNFIVDEAAQTVAVEATSIRPLRATGDEAKMKYVFVFKFRGELVCEMREYVFSTDIARISEAMKLSSMAGKA